MEKTTEFHTYAKPLALLSLAVAVYDIYYLINIFYLPFQQAFGLNNTQMSLLIALNAAMTLCCMPFSGYLCERFSPKSCLVVSVTGSGLLTLWMATMPPYPLLCLIYLLMSVTHLVWAPYVQCVRMLGEAREQGRVFGLSTMIEGAASMVLFLLPTLLLGDRIGQRTQFSRVLLCFGAVFVAVGLAIGLLFDEKKRTQRDPEQERISLRELLLAAKQPQTWLLGAIGAGSYVTLTAITYLGPYLCEAFAFPVAWATVLLVFNRYGLRALGTPLGGLLRDRLGSTGRSLKRTSIVTVLCILLVLAIPQRADYVLLAVPACALVFLGYMLNVNAANMALSEVCLPEHLTGSAIGLSTTLANVGTLLASALCGVVLDRQGSAGYSAIFLLAGAGQGIWFVCGVLLTRRGQGASCPRLPQKKDP